MNIVTPKTDGLYGMPDIDDNCLCSIERTIAFDVYDWSEDSRSAWIYGIVMGWDAESYQQLMQKFHWTEQNVEKNKRYHKQWSMLMSSLEE